jgi:hypothetical protein
MNHADIDHLVAKQLPEWATARASGLELGAMLPTRDGRRTGNAHIIRISPAPKGRMGLQYLILTDAGNTFVMSEPEILSQYYPPQWVADVNETVKKFWHNALPLVVD